MTQYSGRSIAENRGTGLEFGSLLRKRVQDFLDAIVDENEYDSNKHARRRNYPQ